MSKSELEDEFEFQVKAAQLPEPEREYRFHSTRRWRFDFAWPDIRLAFEIEGGIYAHGRHTRGSGFIGDCEKYAEANLLGWWVYRIPGPWVREGKALGLAERALKYLGAIE